MQGEIINYISRRNLEDKSVCMGNEGNTGFTFPLRTMKIEVIMLLHEF